MATPRPRWVTAAFLTLMLWPMAAIAQDPLWKGHMAAGQSAFEQNDLTAARDQFEAALAAAQKFPATDPRIGLTLNNLATVYNFQGEFAKAEPLLLRAREIWKQAPPPGELHLATTLHNLAGLYFSQGRFDDVEPLLQRALQIREQSLPADHPALAKTRKSMATLRRALQQTAEAKPEQSTSAPASGAKPQAAASQQAATEPTAQAQPAAKAESAIKAEASGTAGSASGIAIHLASLRTVEGAKQEWRALQKAHADLVRGLELEIVRVDLGDRGVFQRLVAGPLPDRASATALCRKFKAKDQYCAVVER